MNQQLEDLQSTYEAELQRRSESEAAARSAAQLARNQLEGLRDQVEMLQQQVRGAHQLPGSYGKHNSLVETALVPPPSASPTWPASPNILPDTNPKTVHGGNLDGGFRYTIAAPPSAAYNGTQAPPSEDSEVMAALQELRSASISPNRGSAPPTTRANTTTAGNGANGVGAMAPSAAAPPNGSGSMGAANGAYSAGGFGLSNSPGRDIKPLDGFEPTPTPTYPPQPQQ
ncbi:hypothetical protein DUNSADRAFT_2856 [Dunaliella salina]|uniref:Encoded protein n=1 Tax=Dunaliella salina TaxID=3046 RepID=A0ABQ7GV27_DUNSA|nr:hypothetical protein DUNSADRAFT_2856 [Dunaliella salina]|eukprot:KAF5838462.1 hypothetical protein DUNSADRAFT_2856 [Dunaliella salina]